MRHLSLTLSLLLLSFVAVGCQTESAENAEAEQPAESEWITLFDGESFDGWHGYLREDTPAAWEIQDGAMYFNPETEDGGDIITDDTFDNFELEMEWKIGACGNSGVFFNIVEDPQWDRTYSTAPEMQVLDNTCHPDAENGLDRHAGANYALHAPSEDHTKPAGEWNAVKLVVDGNHVEHWMNGHKIVEYEMYSEEWDALVAASKFANFPGYATGEVGHIGVQDHSDPVWYRNIRIKKL